MMFESNSMFLLLFLGLWQYDQEIWTSRRRAAKVAEDVGRECGRDFG